MVGGASLGLDLAEELRRLAPFGMGNPGVRLLVPSARVRDVRAMGEGKHCRFSLHSGAHRALGVAFGRGSSGGGGGRSGRRRGAARGQSLERLGRAAGGAARALSGGGACLCLPRRGVVGALRAGAAAAARGRRRGGRGGGSGRARDSAWRGLDRGDRRRAALQRRRRAGGVRRFLAPRPLGRSGALRRRRPADRLRSLRGHRGRRAEASGADRLRGARTLAEPRRRVRPRRARRPARLGTPGAARRSSARRLERRRTPIPASSTSPGRRASRGRARGAGGAAGPAAGPDRGLPRAARGRRGERRGAAGGAARRRPQAPQPEAAARCFRVLDELGLVQGAPEGGRGTVGVVSSEGTELERSAAFRAYGARHQEGLRYLERRKQP